MYPCVKTREECNESVNSEFKIMRKSNSLHQIMGVIMGENNGTNSRYSCLLNYF